MCGQQICVLSQGDAWSTNMCNISGGCVVNKYVYYLRWMCGQQICVLTQVDVWSTNVYYLRWMCGQQICVLSQVDVWSTNMCSISGECVVN